MVIWLTPYPLNCPCGLCILYNPLGGIQSIYNVVSEGEGLVHEMCLCSKLYVSGIKNQLTEQRIAYGSKFISDLITLCFIIFLRISTKFWLSKCIWRKIVKFSCYYNLSSKLLKCAFISKSFLIGRTVNRLVCLESLLKGSFSY